MNDVCASVTEALILFISLMYLYSFISIVLISLKSTSNSLLLHYWSYKNSKEFAVMSYSLWHWFCLLVYPRVMLLALLAQTVQLCITTALNFLLKIGWKKQLMPTGKPMQLPAEHKCSQLALSIMGRFIISTTFPHVHKTSSCGKWLPLYICHMLVY